MARHTTTGVIFQQQQNEYPKRMFLKVGPGIGRTAIRIQTAFIADSYRTPVVALHVGTGNLYRAKGFDVSVLPYIKMITCAGEAPTQVVCG